MIHGKSFVGRVFPDGTHHGSFVDALRRDAMFIWNIMVSVVFVAFVTLAVASAVLDLIAIRH
ncbi:MAG TPA: hypothetical protein VNR39_11685 [Pseudolabrys sp.]|nr:hypothetical protein [Pseudolabrys sp.]